MNLIDFQVTPNYLQDTVASGLKGPPPPGPGTVGRETVRGPLPIWILAHACLLGVALCYELTSCQAINEEPCAYLVFHLCWLSWSVKWHFGFTYFLRDFVRLQSHVRPSMYEYQEEVHTYIYIDL